MYVLLIVSETGTVAVFYVLFFYISDGLHKYVHFTSRWQQYIVNIQIDDLRALVLRSDRLSIFP